MSRSSSSRGAAWVAAGIFASRIFGLVRQRVLAHYFGQATSAADALAAAFRIPNFLQNLFGEGALSASFIPEYARLRAQGQTDEARRLAGATAGLLAVVVTLVVVIGVLGTPIFVDVLAPGFEGARRRIAIDLVRIMFPGVGLLVMSAWCLGVLNSHREFFLSYAAPVGWNLAIIATTMVGAYRGNDARLVLWTAYGAGIGAIVQLAVQLPRVWRLLGGVRISLDRRSPSVRTVVRNFGPALLSRGVVQVSAFLDGIIASWLPIGAVAAITNAQLLYTLPVSLFGVSIAAAELPDLAEDTGAQALRDRIERASRNVAFFIVPCAMAMIVLGRPIAGLALQTGRFTLEDTDWLWGTMAGATIGLLASTLGRLFTSAHYALGDTRSPLRFALVRVSLTVALGIGASLYLPPLLGINPRWGTVGLTVSAGLAGWVEAGLLRRSLARHIGRFSVGAGLLFKLWLAAGVAAAVATVPNVMLSERWTNRLFVLAVFGLLYLVLATALGAPTMATLRARMSRRR